MAKRLYRSRDDRMIWGVCGGLAEYFDVDPAIVRVVMVLLVFANGLGILAYVILAIVTPLESSQAAVTGENIEGFKEPASELRGETRSTFAAREDSVGPQAEDTSWTYHRRRMAIGIILLVLGALYAVGNFGFVSWFRWGLLWPLILVAVALAILLAARR
jgi:phage shock protein C